MISFTPQTGKPFQLRKNLAVVLAPNASPMTHMGTNTYILGDDIVAIIDPGPDNRHHLAALETAIAGRQVSHIFVTHSHLDHSPLAKELAIKNGAAVYAFGDSMAGRSAVMQELAQTGLAGGGEGIDLDFTPDHILLDGQEIAGPWGALTAVHTPGHLGNHLCFAWRNAVFTGDHVMGWASSLVSPPDGDLTDFMASCEKLRSCQADVYYPGHGAPIANPHERLDWLIAHRRSREAQVLLTLSDGPMSPKEITKILYTDVPSALHPAAERNVFAHLIDLHQRGCVIARARLSADASFELI